MEVLDCDLALAEALPQLDQVARRARGALGQRTGLLHQVQRAMRRFVGQLQHVIEAQPRIRHVFLGEIDQARVDAEALQRRLQIAGELAQLEEQHALAPLQQRVELAEERCLVAGGERVGRARSTVSPNSSREVWSVAIVMAQPHGALPRILSIFSLSVIAVNGLMT